MQAAKREKQQTKDKERREHRRATVGSETERERCGAGKRRRTTADIPWREAGKVSQRMEGERPGVTHRAERGEPLQPSSVHDKGRRQTAAGSVQHVRAPAFRPFQKIAQPPFACPSVDPP